MTAQTSTTTQKIPDFSQELADLGATLQQAGSILLAHRSSMSLTPEPVQLRLLAAQIHAAVDETLEALRVVSVVTEPVLGAVQQERDRQDAKWGEQNHPSVDEVLMGREGSCHPEVMAEQYEIPTAARARRIAQNMAARGRVTWTHILVEEVAEAVEAAALNKRAHLRAELVQVAAVAVAWIEALDRRHSKAGEQ